MKASEVIANLQRRFPNEPEYIQAVSQVLGLSLIHILLDMGFSDDIKTIASKLPKTCQTIMFSATMPEKIEELANLSFSRIFYKFPKSGRKRKRKIMNSDGLKSA